MIFDPENKYKLNFYRGSFLDSKFDDHMRNVWKVEKFDRCAENPPFNQMIDMDFLTKCHNICDQIAFIHPSTWLLDEKNKQQKFLKTKEIVKNTLDKFTLFNGNKIFQISLFVPCAITFFNKNKKGDGIICNDLINDIELIYDDIYQINKFSNRNEYFSIKRKISNLMKENKIDNLDNRKIFNISTKRNNKKHKIDKCKHLNTENEYYINIAQIRGNVNKNSDKIMIQDDFYTIITKDNTVQRRIDNHMFFKFINAHESNNFIEFLKTNFVRFCLSVNKNNSQLECGEMAFIPYLDFSDQWNDDRLYKYFDLNEEEIKFIEKYIPKYY